MYITSSEHGMYICIYQIINAAQGFVRLSEESRVISSRKISKENIGLGNLFNNIAHQLYMRVGILLTC